MSCNVRSCDVPCNGHVVCSKWFCDNVVKVVFCTTQYKSVLQSTTPVLLCTTQLWTTQRTTTDYSSTAKYYSNTTLYYTVLQRTTPVLPCTTKYYSSTNLYCKVTPVLQSTIPVLLWRPVVVPSCRGADDGCFDLMRLIARK